MPAISADDVLRFWFEEAQPADWFRKSAEFDARIRGRFLSTYHAAARAELFAWRDTPRGRLAEVVVLDQFSRNVFRDSPLAFAGDPLALALAQEAVRQRADQALVPRERAFLYLPYMHSESLLVHDEAARLFDQPGLENNLDFERKHRAILDRFGRYPHRNAVLGRESTPEELEFLAGPGSSF